MVLFTNNRKKFSTEDSNKKHPSRLIIVYLFHLKIELGREDPILFEINLQYTSRYTGPQAQYYWGLGGKAPNINCPQGNKTIRNSFNKERGLGGLPPINLYLFARKIGP